MGFPTSWDMAHIMRHRSLPDLTKPPAAHGILATASALLSRGENTLSDVAGNPTRFRHLSGAIAHSNIASEPGG